jgi:hypothetical protein
MDREERARFDLLKAMTDKGKFAAEVGMALSPVRQDALEWMQLNGWITLIDVTPLASDPGKLFRVFLASEDARSWYRKQQ